MQTAEQSLSFTLPAALTAETAESFTESLRQLPLAQKAALHVDASAVEDLSTCGAQILVALHKALRAVESELVIEKPKSFFNTALQEMGLGWLLNAQA